MKRSIIRTLVILLFSQFAVAVPQRRQPLNVLLIMVDDMGWMDLHCQGNDKLDTPHVDQLAKQGMRFTDAYAAAPVCSPTRAALITGYAPARLGVTQHGPNNANFGPRDSLLLEAETSGSLPLEQVTLAERLKETGYATAFLGKWHLSNTKKRNKKRGNDLAFYPEHQGFDINVGGNSRGGPATYFDPYRNKSIPPRKTGEYLTYRLADETIDYMRTHREAPFFICLWTYNVHYPFQAPAPLVTKYEQRLGDGLINATYGGQVEATDIAIGRVLDELDKLELTDNTLVIFTSDNGGWSGATDNRPLRKGKGWLYEGGIRVPLIIRWPGVTKPGTESRTPVISMDLSATILQAVGVSLPKAEALDGESLRPLLARTGKLRRNAIYFHYPHYAFHGDNRPGGAIREGRYKLIERFDDGSVELYDLEADLGEAEDLAKEKPAVAKRLLEKLNQWQRETGAKMPTRR